MGVSPTQRTLKALKDQKIKCGIVERFNPHVGPHGIRQDLFGFIDIIALEPGRGIVAIQSTGQAFSQHEHKLLGERREECIDWLECGGKIDLWGWRKKKKRLKDGSFSKGMYWFHRYREFTLADFDV